MWLLYYTNVLTIHESQALKELPTDNKTKHGKKASSKNLFTSKETFYSMLKDAYTHPVEKRNIRTSPDIVNDTYNFIKKYKQETVKETNYKDIIMRSQLNDSDEDDLNLSLLNAY